VTRKSVYSRSRLRAAAVVGCALAGVAGCGAPEDTTPAPRVSWSLSPSPARIGPAQLRLELADSAGAALEGAVVTVEANMTHPGMKPQFASAAELGAGRYRADLDFDMAGDWVLLVESVFADGRRWTERLDVPAVRPR
jgi:hypothetical protein